MFMTRGVSLQGWADSGILQREIAVYNELAIHFGRVYIFTYGGKGDLAFRDRLAPNVEVVPARLALPKFAAMLLMPLRSAGFVRKCDCFKSNQMFGALAAVIAGRLFRKPVIIRSGYTLTKFLRQEGVKGFKAALGGLEERIAYRACTVFIVSSRHDFEYVRGRYRLEPSRGMVLPNYIDTGLFRPLGGAKSRDVAFVGRLTPQKNLEALLEALAGTGLTATFVGQGELEAGLRALADRLGVDVAWKGAVKNHDLPALLDSHRIFALVSRFEGMPKSLLEAMACGLPPVGADVEGINEVIADGEDGLIGAGDPASIRERLLRLAGDPDLRRRLGENARRKMEARYSLQGLVAGEATFYRERLFPARRIPAGGAPP